MKNTQVKVSELLALVQRDFREKEKRSAYIVNLYIDNQLIPYFGDRSANYVLEKTIDDYKDKRLAEGASKVTVSRELQVLKRAYNLGLKRRLIRNVPVIELFPEPPPREGSYEIEELKKFVEAARAIGSRKNFDGNVVADIVTFAYFSGWRLNECLSLHRDWIKVKERLAVVPAAKHKNKKPKILPLDGMLWEMIESRLATCSHDGYLFHRNGRQIKSIRRLCNTVCEMAELSQAHFFHNLRRSFRTNLGRAGVDDQTGMKLMGHSTMSVYNNYNQISIERMREALARTQKTLEPPMEEKQVPQERQDSLDSSEVLAEREGFEPPHDVSHDLISSQASEGKLAKLLKKMAFFGLTFKKG